MKRVFISSTSTDLKTHREAVRDAILALDMLPVMMEHFPAMDANAIAACKAKVLDSDIFVGIYAHRYGYIPDGHEQSITEMEYEWAAEAGIPIHIFVVNDDYDWPADDYDEHQDELYAFKYLVGKDKVWKTFTNPDSLARAVSESLRFDKDTLSNREKKQRRQLMTGFGVLLVLILLVIGFVLTSGDPDEAEIGQSQANQQATNQANATATQLNITPSPTPIEGEPADTAAGEIVIVVAKFEQSGETQQEPDIDMLDVLTQAASRYENVRVIAIDHSIENREQAQQISEIYQATMVIYGRISDGGVTASYELEPRTSNLSVGFDEDIRVSQADVSNLDVFLFDGLDSRFILEFTLGQLAIYQGNHEDAVLHLQSALNLVDDDRADELNIYYLRSFLGYSLEQTGDIERARENYQAAINLDVVTSIDYLIRGNNYYGLEAYDQAIDDYNQAIELDAENSSAHNNRGLAYLAISEYEQAIADFNRAIERDAENIFIYNSRGNAYTALGEYEQAIDDFTQIIELDATAGFAYYNRGNTYASMGDYQQAISDYDRAIELNTTYAVAFSNRGIAYFNLEDYQQAITDFDQAIELDPENARTYNNRGNVYVALGEYEQAIEDFNRAIELDAQNAFAYYSRGNAYYDSEQYQQAIADYDRAIELNADYILAYYNRGVAYLLLSEFENAIQDLETTILLDDQNINFYCMLGYAQNQATEFSDAIENLQYCVDNVSGDVSFWQDALNNAMAQVEDELSAEDPTSEPEISAAFENGSIILIEGVRPILTFAEAGSVDAGVVCLAGTEAVVLQTVEVATNSSSNSDSPLAPAYFTRTNWVELDCGTGTGWLLESDLIEE